MSFIKTAMDRTAEPGNEPRWNEVFGEFLALTSGPLTQHVRRLLYDIVNFEGELQLDETSPMVHRMSPENMLRLQAAIILASRDSDAFLPILERMVEFAKPASFRSGLRSILERNCPRKNPAKIQAE
jgi:hypothetical protein